MKKNDTKGAQSQMLTQDQKEAILRSAGIEIPRRGSNSQAQQQAQDGAVEKGNGQADGDGRAQTTKTYARAIETLFDQYTRQRASRSLSEAGESLHRAPRPHAKR